MEGGVPYVNDFTAFGPNLPYLARRVESVPDPGIPNTVQMMAVWPWLAAVRHYLERALDVGDGRDGSERVVTRDFDYSAKLIFSYIRTNRSPHPWVQLAPIVPFRVPRPVRREGGVPLLRYIRAILNNHVRFVRRKYEAFLNPNDATTTTPTTFWDRNVHERMRYVCDFVELAEMLCRTRQLGVTDEHREDWATFVNLLALGTLECIGCLRNAVHVVYDGADDARVVHVRMPGDIRRLDHPKSDVFEWLDDAWTHHLHWQRCRLPLWFEKTRHKSGKILLALTDIAYDLGRIMTDRLNNERDRIPAAFWLPHRVKLTPPELRRLVRESMKWTDGMDRCPCCLDGEPGQDFLRLPCGHAMCVPCAKAQYVTHGTPGPPTCPHCRACVRTHWCTTCNTRVKDWRAHVRTRTHREKQGLRIDPPVTRSRSRAPLTRARSGDSKRRRFS